MKRLAVICILALLVSLLALPASAEATGSLSLSDASGKQGDTVTMTVSLDSNPGLISMRFSVSYPEDLVLTGVSDTKLLAGWTKPSGAVSSPYTIRWADSLAEQNSVATGNLVTLTFRIRDDAVPGDKTVSVEFIESRDYSGGKNSFNSPAAAVKVTCKTHSFGSWSKISDTQEQRACASCGYTETVTAAQAPAGKTHKLRLVAASAPTHQKEGTREHYQCTQCAKRFADIEASKELTEKEILLEKQPHSFREEYSYDEQAHWHSCQCGEISQKESHAWTADAQDAMLYRCVCGAVTNEMQQQTLPAQTPAQTLGQEGTQPQVTVPADAEAPDEPRGISPAVWIVLALLLAGGAAAAVVIRRKK